MKKKIGTIRSLTVFVIISILIVVIYSIAEFIISTITGVTHDVLTGSIYAFFGTEIGACGFIRIFKLRRNDNDS